MDILQRLIKFRDYTGLTNSQFADRAGIPRPTLSQFLNGRNKRLSDDFTSKLHAAYPELNVMWLLFGEGSMVTDGNFEISEGKTASEATLFDQQMSEPEANDFEEMAYYGTSAQIGNYGQNVQSVPYSAIQPARRYNKTDIAKTDIAPRQPAGGEDKASYDDTASAQPRKPAAAVSAVTAAAASAEPSKRIKYIMVFYNDNSYEKFSPEATALKEIE